jgi:hypothetical protein
MEIFFVSTLGQARVAVAYIRQNKVSNVKVFLLYTIKNKKVPRLISGYLNEFDVDYQWFKLPLSPTTPIPWRLNRLRNKYKRIINDNVGAVWVFNRNTHYLYIYEISKERKIKVGYLEEGLSSYKEDANFDFVSNSLLVKDFLKSVGSYIYKHRKESFFALLLLLPYYLIVFLKKEISFVFKFIAFLVEKKLICFFSSGLFKRISTYLGMGYKDFYRSNNNFDDSYFVFPEKNKFIFSDKVHKLDLLYSFSEERVNELSHYVADFSFKSVFVSQKYPGSNFYDQIALALKELHCIDNDRILIKFHPRETSKDRMNLLKALEELEVNYITSDIIDSYSLEELLMAKKDLNIWFGFTSTSLIYSKEIFPNLCVVSIVSCFNLDLEKFGNLKEDYYALCEFDSSFLSINK